MKKNNKKKGFTIVELVIVIAVIGILSAILIPTFVSIVDNAKDAALKSDLANAYSMYVADAADGIKDKEAGSNAADVYFPKVVAQNKVILKDASNSYHFNDEKNAWELYTGSEDKGVAYTGTNAETNKATVTYGIYTVWSKEAVLVQPTNP